MGSPFRRLKEPKRDMGGYYASVLRQIPTAFNAGFEGWAFLIFTVGAPAYAAIRQGLPDNNDPWWMPVVPLAFSLLYGLAKANYNRVFRLEQELYELRRTDEERAEAARLHEGQRRLLAEINGFIRDGEHILGGLATQSTIEKMTHTEFGEWEQRVYRFLKFYYSYHAQQFQF